VTKGYFWEFKTEPTKQKKKDEEKPEPNSIEEAMKTRATPYQHSRTEMLLRLLHEKFPSDQVRH
jgi:hypothetical protein